MTTVTATLQINFATEQAAAAAGTIILEIDDRPDGLNGGDTEFRPGDDVYYLLYRTGIALTNHVSTGGSIANEGGGFRAISGEDAEYLVLVEAREASLRYPASAGLSSYDWLGRVYDANVNVISEPAPVLYDNGNTIRFPQKVTGILKVEYNAPYDAYRLTNVDEDLDRVLIYARGTLL